MVYEIEVPPSKMWSDSQQKAIDELNLILQKIGAGRPSSLEDAMRKYRLALFERSPSNQEPE